MAEELRNNEVQEEEQVEKAERIDLGASLRKEHKEKKPVNRKLTVLIAILAIVAVAALALVLPKVLTPKQTEAPVQDLTVNLANYTSDDVVRVSVDSDTNDFTITRTGKGDEAVYYMDAFEQELLNQGTCSSAFIQAATLPCDQLVEENAADLAKYGLDKPTSVLTVEYADGNSIVVELGGMLDVSGQVYCRLQGEDDVYAMRLYMQQIYGGSVSRYRSLALPVLNTDVTTTKSVIVRQAGQEQIRFLPQTNSVNASTRWLMTEPNELWLDSGAISELVEAVASVQLYDYQGRFENLAQFGLEEPWFEIIISDTQGGKRTFRFGNYDEERSIYYCTIDDSGDVFTVYNTYTGMFEDFKVAYYLDKFTNIMAISAVDKMEVSDGSKTYVLTIEREEQYDEDGKLKVLGNGQPDYLETFFVDGKECQEKAFKSAYSAVISVTISNMADQALVDETQKPVVTIDYTFNNGEAPITVEYLPYDINNYCVRRDGKIDLICKRELVDPIMPTLQSLVNGELDVEE